MNNLNETTTNRRKRIQNYKFKKMEFYIYWAIKQQIEKAKEQKNLQKIVNKDKYKHINTIFSQFYFFDK